jgi:CRP-like cAMP-binding protein
MAGQSLYWPGEAARSVYFLQSGLVKTTLLSAAGQQLILRIYKPGDVLGELCCCAGERREQAVALEPSDVAEVPVGEFLARLREDPEIMFDFLGAVCTRLAEAYDRLYSQSVEPAMERLARTLLKLAEALGQARPEGLEISHHIKQEELAQMIGTRREVVSGLLNRLREQGLLTYGRRGPIRMDPAALRRYLEDLTRQ